MPDHPRGYVHRQKGLQPPDDIMAERYRSRQKGEAVLFDDRAQVLMVDTAVAAGPHINAIVHAVGIEPTHIHVLLSWKHDRAWRSMRRSIRTALSRALNSNIARQGSEGWFSDSPSRKRVRDHEHFDYLVLVYLPQHSRSWVREADRVKAENRDAQREVSVRRRAR